MSTKGKILITAGIVVVSAFVLSACMTIPSFQGPPPASDNVPSEELANISIPGVPAEAVPLFVENCSACHGPTGEGSGIAPPLNSEELRARLDDQAIAATITNGRPGTAMPAWGGRLSDEEIAALVALIRNWDQLDEEQLSQIAEQAEECAGPMGPMHPGMGPMMGGGCDSEGERGPWWMPGRP